MYEPCEHLKNYKRSKGVTSYKVLHAFYVVRLAKGSSKRKTLEVECRSCHMLASRAHACLHCVYFGCFRRRHIHEHAAKENHSLAMDILSGNVFCFGCKDYIYDEDFSTISRQQKQEGKIRGLTTYVPWEPSKEEVEVLKDHELKKIKNESHIGLRGLYNMGNTCYMNCIIQVLVHTPLLRDYFLSDKHGCFKGKDICWSCMMSDIFQEFFSGWTTPLSLETLLFVTWRDISTLFGCEMHDAQEFFSTLLDALHSCESQGEEVVPDKKDCICVIHQVFSGFSQSDIRCLSCENLSTTISSFWDVNLDFGPDELSTPLRPESKLRLKNFIERYTRTESLHSPCGSCGSTKRTIHVTFKKLPVVICFHFKRLRYKGPKISTQVLFPEYLDMSPYITTSKTTEMRSKDALSDLDADKNVFTLFAVVCHRGDAVSGHYFSYIRQQNAWYKCDDHRILKVDINTMLNSEGYLLFYHKGVLEYELEDPKPIECDQEMFEGFVSAF